MIKKVVFKTLHNIFKINIPFSLNLGIIFYNKFYSNCERYQAPIDIFKKVYVNPNVINRVYGSLALENILTGFGKVKNGDWDINVDAINYKDWMGIGNYRFNDTIFHKSMVEHFHNGIRWGNTPFISLLINQANKGEKIGWDLCYSLDDIHKRCENLDKLYENIRYNGYLTQEMVEYKPGFAGFLSSIINEIIVCIGRDGTFYFVNGKHRLSIAKILRIQKVPVVFLIRHKKWMEYRDYVYVNNLNNRFHADFEEFLNP